MHGDKITCTFDDNKLSISFLNSVAENTKDTEKRAALSGSNTDSWKLKVENYSYILLAIMRTGPITNAALNMPGSFQNKVGPKKF